MKKTFLRSAAIAVAVTGASAAHAVHVNPDGLGQVLLYPYYTVQNNFVTAIHVVNTTDQAKAVKVRFLEGKNSEEVLDFNLYLSPFDVWTGSVVADAVNGAKLVSNDTSCIAPRQLSASGEAFRNFEFVSDPLSSDPNRRAEGYVEIIDMGALTTAAQAAAVTHTAAGVPSNCGIIQAADTAGTVTTTVPDGGLFGSGHLVSVEGGVRASYDPTAIDNFADAVLWTPAGDLQPSLEQAIPFAEILDGNQIVDFFAASGIDAVSAVLTQDEIFNEYAIDAGRLSQTDWVITFPTKWGYVNNADPSPFQRVWNPGTAAAPVLQSCHDVAFTYYNREEATQTPAGGDFSPKPPTSTFGLCTEVNTLTLYKSGTSLADARLFGAVSTAAALSINNFDAGWLKIRWAQEGDSALIPAGTGVLVDSNGTSVYGLPVIGFSASRNVNTVDVQIGGLNVYSAVMGENSHKGSKDIVLGGG
jgi:hypothetical protein